MSNYLIYQAYGYLDIFNELIYSVYSLYAQYPERNPDCNIIIYTDNQVYLQKFLPAGVIYEPLHSAQIKEWRGEKDFVHRAKIKILQNLVQKYQGNYLYVDTDTVFKVPMDRVFEEINSGKLYMHDNEGKLSGKKNAFFRKLYNFLKRENTRGRLNISPDTKMWNAGVIGFNSSQADLLDKVLITSDLMYQLYSKHVMEQLAFSYWIGQYANQNIQSAKSLIFHYWNFKEYRPILAHFFQVYESATIEERINKIHLINPEELIKPKMAYEALPFFPRNWRKWTNNRWQMPDYQLI